jgi:hypothetical protein
LQIRKTNCNNCIVWAKSDDIGRDIIKLSKDVVVSFLNPFIIHAYNLSGVYFRQMPSLSQVGYIVMVDMSMGRRTELVRIEGAKVAGIYHPLIDEKVMKVMHG